MRKVILYIATSLDGYIADCSGGVSWLAGQDENYQGNQGYSEFAADIDTVVMGYKTYHQVATELSPNEWPYKEMTSYVLTHQKITSSNEIVFANESASDLLTELKQQEGKSIWICL